MSTAYTPTSISGGVNTQTSINANFTDIQTALSRQLNRYGDTGTGDNVMHTDLDFNSNDLLNGGTVNCADIVVAGVSLMTQVNAAATSATNAATSATNAATSETNAATSASDAAASASSIDLPSSPIANTYLKRNSGNTAYDAKSVTSVWNDLVGTVGAAQARTDLGVTASGSDTTYCYRANNLADVADVPSARSSLGLGSLALQAASNVTITGGSITGINDLAVADGGTGQSTYTNGQLLIGNSTGNTLSKATLTAGSGITITNGGGSITITNSSPATSVNGALVYNSANQAVNTGTITTLLWDNEDYDTSSIHDLVTDTWKLTVPAGASKVRVRANIQWNYYPAVTDNVAIVIYKNGSPFDGQAAAIGPNRSVSICTAVVNVTPGDYFYVSAYQISGSTQYIAGGGGPCTFSMEIIQ